MDYELLMSRVWGLSLSEGFGVSGFRTIIRNGPSVETDELS